MPPAKDNLTESLYRRRTAKKPARKKPPRTRRTRMGRTMALDPFFVATLVLVACAVALQFFLMVWLEFF